MMEWKTDSPPSPARLRILAVEDEFLIGAALKDTFDAAGADITVVPSVSAALRAIAEETPSAALLDVQLGRQTVDDVAAALAARGVPFLFYSGHGLPDELREKYPDKEVLLKPVTPRIIVEAVFRAAGA